MEFEKTIALVTGGASGLGRAALKKIISSGGKCAAFDLNASDGKNLLEEAPGSIFINGDITSEEDVRNALSEIKEHFGCINTVVNCAGILLTGKTAGKKGPHDFGTFKRVIEVNLIGTFNVMRLAAEEIKKNNPVEGERGVIINTSSIAAFEGQVGQVAYAASKAGVAGITLPAARDLSVYGIRVVTIAPGIFDTPMMSSVPDEFRESLSSQIPFPQRFGYPEEYGEMVLEVIKNRMLNGATIRLDGGLRMMSR